MYMSGTFVGLHALSRVDGSSQGSGEAEASSSGRPPQAVQASSSGAGRGSLQPHPRRASLAGRHGSKQRMQPRSGPDSWNAKEETEASR